MKHATKGNDVPGLLLRIGLAFVFLYAGIASLQQPLEWEGYVPHVVAVVFGATTGLRLIALVEIGLGVWLLTGKYAKYAAGSAVIMFAGIILVNLNQLIVTFRDIGLLFAALALYFTES